MDFSSLEHSCQALCARTKRFRPAPQTQTVNDSIAFMSPMPGYQGYVPPIRRDVPRSKHPQDLFSVTARDFRIPLRLQQGPDFRMQKDDMTDYRALAHRYTGRSSGFIKDQGAPHLSSFSFNIGKSEFGF